jgi:5-methylcytosine-specific restriction endonuclease McrA
VAEAPATLQAAVTSVAEGDLDEARWLVLTVDRGALWEFWFSAGVESAAHRPPSILVDREVRDIKGGQVTAATARAVFARDGWRCRYCGLRVIDKASLWRLSRALPLAFPWGNRSGNSHPATVVLAATPDHVVPRHRGGSHDLINLVTACGACQHQAKGTCTLEELGMSDPRDRPPVLDEWDGCVGLPSPAVLDALPTVGGVGGIDPDEKPENFDPEIEYLVAAARVGRSLPAIEDPALLDKVATIFEDHLRFGLMR